MAAFFALTLVAILVLRPMELSPALLAAHPLETLCVLTAAAIAWESATAKTAFGPSPPLRLLLPFVAWCFVAEVVTLGSAGIASAWQVVALAAIFMTLTVLALRSYERLLAAVVVLGASLLFVMIVAVHQGMQPTQCVRVLGEDESPSWIADGRACEGARACEEGGEPDADYLCERIGWFETYSAGTRVRWRGQLEDPNELAVFIGAVLPFVLVLSEGKRRVIRLAEAAYVALGVYTLTLTQSRGGTFVVVTVLLLYCVRRFGVRGVLGAVALGGPLLLLGWREGAEAESSALERAEILVEGIGLVRTHWMVGVGPGQFAAEMFGGHTAHNTYVLMAAELGVFGYLLWATLMWFSIKIPVSLALAPPPGLDPRLHRFAEALAMSLVGLLVGIFFLSFGYKQLLFVFLGIAGALHGAARREAPHWRLGLTARDVLGIVVVAVAALAAAYVLARSKVGK